MRSFSSILLAVHSPAQAKQHKIQLGALIVQSETESDTVTIVAFQVPIGTLLVAKGLENTRR
jgi:hypothetical protein